MRVTLISDIYGERNNGTSITARRMVKSLAERGHEVTVISPYKPCDGNLRHPVRYVTLKKRHMPFIGKYIEQKNGVSFAEIDEEKLTENIRRSDVVHFLLPFRVCKAGIKIALEYGIPFTTAFHCQPENITSHMAMMNIESVNRLIYKYFYYNYYRRAMFIHCPSRFIADQLSMNGYKGRKYVISNGVVPVFCKTVQTDRNRQTVQSVPSVPSVPYTRDARSDCSEFRDKFYILFTGRYAAEKRHDLLIEAVRRSENADRIQLIFAGNGPRKEKIARMGERLPNKPVLGFYSEDELCGVINSCDLYVHPSDVEIEAISCVEAFTCGLVPVISDSPRSATGQFALTRENLFRHGDAASLAARIDYWISHEEERRELSARYLEYGKNFSIDKCMDNIEIMLADAVRYYTVEQYAENPVWEDEVAMPGGTVFYNRDDDVIFDSITFVPGNEAEEYAVTDAYAVDEETDGAAMDGSSGRHKA